MSTVLVTGATGGIGLETARVLASLGHDVVLHGRDARKGELAVAQVRAEARGSVSFVRADFSSLAEVRRLAAELNASVPRLDILVNNAGCAQFSRTQTVDGYETTFAVNHLAPFLLTNLLLEKIRNSAPARIVNVASRAHRYQSIDFDDLMSTEDYKVMRTYGRSKLANILFTRSLAERLRDTGVTANCLHPGVVATGLGQNNGFARVVGWIVMHLVGISIPQGARTSIYLATSPEVAGTSGVYFSDCRPASLLTSPEAVSEQACERLWTQSERLVGLPCSSR
ncbi:MAG TPA: SDR family oxidoreductase [Steroidobacteraceae bacterium]|nr:SDR family oxidoreductase [Steroidobacteraceae bacterium]